ncbi:MAG: hypothetical protein RBS78_08595 [Coriobacteriia bacterium]|nr:hypothetical protein [Coriobacteriia bacterium]
MGDALARYPVLRGVFWAATWGLGAAIGIALGGWLTVASGGAGAPGADSLDVVGDVVVLPLAVGTVVFAVHLVGQVVVAGVRRARARNTNGCQDEHKQSVRDDVSV